MAALVDAMDLSVPGSTAISSLTRGNVAIATGNGRSDCQERPTER